MRDRGQLCAQVMDDQQWIKYTAITSPGNPERTQVLAGEFIIQLSEDCIKCVFSSVFWFILQFIKVGPYQRKTSRPIHSRLQRGEGNNLELNSDPWTTMGWGIYKILKYIKKKAVEMSSLSTTEEHEWCWGKQDASTQTDGLAHSPLIAQTSGVRGFGQHGVGGTNPAEPRGLWTLISTWSALHFFFFQGNTQAPPVIQNGSKVVKLFSQHPACLFLLGRLIVNHFAFNCGGGLSLSICSSKPLGACNSINVMLGLVHLVLRWQHVSHQPLSTAWRQALRNIIDQPLGGVICKLPLSEGREPWFLSCPALASL